MPCWAYYKKHKLCTRRIMFFVFLEFVYFGFDRKPRKSLCPSVFVSVCDFVEFFTLLEREILRLVFKQ